jgi:hypothetical protein
MRPSFFRIRSFTSSGYFVLAIGAPLTFLALPEHFRDSVDAAHLHPGDPADAAAAHASLNELDDQQVLEDV